MKYFAFLVEAIILIAVIFLNIKMFKSSIEEGGEEDRLWKWIILLCSFALVYFMLNATYEAIFLD